MKQKISLRTFAITGVAVGILTAGILLFHVYPSNLLHGAPTAYERSSARLPQNVASGSSPQAQNQTNTSSLASSAMSFPSKTYKSPPPEAKHPSRALTIFSISDIATEKSGTVSISSNSAPQLLGSATAPIYTGLRFTSPYPVLYPATIKSAAIYLYLANDTPASSISLDIGLEKTSTPSDYSAKNKLSKRANNLLAKSSISVKTPTKHGELITIDVTKQVRAMQKTLQYSNQPLSFIIRPTKQTASDINFATDISKSPQLVLHYADNAKLVAAKPTLTLQQYAGSALTGSSATTASTKSTTPNAAAGTQQVTGTLTGTFQKTNSPGNYNQRTISYTINAKLATNIKMKARIVCGLVPQWVHDDGQPFGFLLSHGTLQNMAVQTNYTTSGTTFTLSGTTASMSYDAFATYGVMYVECVGFYTNNGTETQINLTNGYLNSQAIVLGTAFFAFPAPTPSSQYTSTINVAQISYIPLDAQGYVDSNYAGFNNFLGSSMLDRVNVTSAEQAKALGIESEYNGALNQPQYSVPSLQYKITYTQNYSAPAPVSSQFQELDYMAMMNKENICNLVDNQGVREVWLWTYANDKIASLVESNMAQGTISKAYWSHGAYGDISNSYQLNDLPVCNHTYVVYNHSYNYTQALGYALHDHGHQIEYEMDYLNHNLWSGGYQNPFGTNYGLTHCGTVHNPPDTNASDPYDYVSQFSVRSSCESGGWLANGSGTAVSCTTWYGINNACDQYDEGAKYYIWYGQSLPAANSNMVLQGRQLRNWWGFFSDYDKAIASGGLLQPPQFQPTHLGSESGGSLETYLLGSDNKLWGSVQPASGGTWNAWKTLGAPTNATANRTTAMNQNGTQAIFMGDQSGNLWYNSETTARSNTWSGWSNLGNPGNGVSFSHNPILGVNVDGRLEVFEIGSNGALYHNYQQAPNGGWAGWFSLNTPSGTSIQAISVGTNQDGRMEVFEDGSNGSLEHLYQVTPNGGWSSWSSLGNPGQALGSLVVATNQDGRQEIFANGANGQLYHLYQVAPNKGWSGWSAVASQSGFSFNKFTSSYQGPVTGSNANGHLDIFELDSNGNIEHNYQQAPNGGWAGWSGFGKPTGVNVTSLSINNNTDGELTIVITGNDGNMWYTYQMAPNGGWSGWAKASPPSGVSFRSNQ
jgi:hypothetical protein